MDLLVTNPGLDHVPRQILRELDAPTIQKCRLVSKSWYNLIENDNILWISLYATLHLSPLNAESQLLSKLGNKAKGQYWYCVKKYFKNKDKLVFKIPDLKAMSPDSIRKSMRVLQVMSSYFKTELRCYHYLKGSSSTIQYHPIVTALKKGYQSKSLYKDLLQGLNFKDCQRVIRESMLFVLESAEIKILKVFMELAKDHSINFDADWHGGSLLQNCYDMRCDIQIIELVMSNSNYSSTENLLRQASSDFLTKRKRSHDLMTLWRLAMNRFDGTIAEELRADYNYLLSIIAKK